MQAIIIAISLYLFSSINSNETQKKNAISIGENNILQLTEVNDLY